MLKKCTLCGAKHIANAKSKVSKTDGFGAFWKGGLFFGEMFTVFFGEFSRVLVEGRKEGRKEGGREGGREEGRQGGREGGRAARQADR